MWILMKCCVLLYFLKADEMIGRRRIFCVVKGIPFILKMTWLPIFSLCQLFLWEAAKTDLEGSQFLHCELCIFPLWRNLLKDLMFVVFFFPFSFFSFLQVNKSFKPSRFIKVMKNFGSSNKLVRGTSRTSPSFIVYDGIYWVSDTFL